MVTKEEVDQVVVTVEDFQKACLRNNFFVPKYKSRLCTREFLQEVRSGRCYVPKISELKPGICAEPPSNEVVRAELITVLQNGIANLPYGPERDSYERLVHHL